MALLTRLYLLWQAELEYYLDAELTPDEDADTVELHPSSSAEAVEGERGRDHVLQLTASDATCLLSADTAEELQEWVALLSDGWVEEGGAKETKGFGELMGRMLSLKPQSKAAKDSAALGLGRTATLGFGRTKTATKADTLPKTSSLMPGRKAAAAASMTRGGAPPPHQDASQGGCSIVEEEEEEGEEEEEEQSAAVVHSGYMAKKGEGFVAGWKQKWLVLHADGGLTYADSEAKPPTGRIELAVARKQDLQRSKGSSSSDYSFSVKASKVKWHLNPGTEKAFDAWEQKLMSVMKG